MAQAKLSLDADVVCGRRRIHLLVGRLEDQLCLGSQKWIPGLAEPKTSPRKVGADQNNYLPHKKVEAP